jgi:hypothetical protein
MIKLKTMNRIRKAIFCFSLLLIFSASAAQEFGFGLKGGLNLSTLDLEDPEASYDSRTGYHLGLFLRSKFDKVGIQPEFLLYTQNGDIESSLFGTAQESFSYLTIPLIIKFYPVGGLNLQVGPQFGFLLDGERKYDTPFLGSGSQDITEHYDKSDISLALGGGYDFGFGLGIDVRYNLGIKDINNAADGEPVKSRVFMVSLGWNFIRN